MLSKKSLALAARVLATYTHSELSNLFLLFDIEDSAPAGTNKLSRAMGVIKRAENDPGIALALESLLRHVVEMRNLSTEATRGDLSPDEAALVQGLEQDEFIGKAASGAAGEPAPPAPQSSVRSPRADDTTFTHDFFISHASEDKESFVRPLATELVGRGCAIWYDEFSLDIGDSLRESIDFGLGSSRFGAIVLSRAFFGKEWPNKELGALAGLERNGRKVMLPIWHGVNEDEVRQFSPMLADLVAVNSRKGISYVADSLERQLDKRSAHRSVATVELAPGVVFRNHLRAPNSRAWSVVVAAPVPEGSAALDDRFHDSVQAVFERLDLNAVCYRQTDDYTMWSNAESNPTWIGEVFKGPVLVLMKAMPTTTSASTPTVSVDLSRLIRWWLQAIAAALEVIGPPATGPLAVGFSLNPYPVEGGSVTGLEFGSLPPAQRIAASHPIPPWEFSSVCVEPQRAVEEVTAAAASLLKVFSYRRIDSTLAAIRTEAVGAAGREPIDIEPNRDATAGTTINENYEPIRLLHVIAEDVTLPRTDGTRGSALYQVPILLSREPTPQWCRWFVEAWDHPPEFTTLHRPRIASVVGDRIVLDGTSLEEIRDYHQKTLRLAVDIANRHEATEREAGVVAEQQDLERSRRHQEEVRRLADEVSFD